MRTPGCLPRLVNTSSTPLMHHKTPISGEWEVSCLLWPGVDAIVCVIRLLEQAIKQGADNTMEEIRKADLSV